MKDHNSDDDWQLLRPGVDVKQAMAYLNEMDERLHNHTKRQRRAIEDSHIASINGRSEEKALLRGNRTPKRALINDKVKEEDEGEPAFPSPQSIETAPMSDGEAKQVAECIQEDAADAEPEGQDVSFERGAARPPPVNSDYLPLPWKGRLGYVSAGSGWTYLEARS
jgi:UV DNA damage endonuclease